ncbi:uroporphyrinogen-III C-methyltransferase [Niallia sp. 03133]|uniref:uroporphyrinogen-III C-methyltransferase n=1 Tax=Niallia sp. 03133 TaxID=3458060 RepID=UPI004043AF1A
MQKGKVYLVGAGPGDAELITVKGLEAIKRADVILYDRLINPNLLNHAQTDCEFIYCGKLPNRHFLRQDVINSLLVEKALAGKTVVRLKGGDPSVFGRVGEEALAVAEHNIEFEMVPGITSGIAAPLYAGIPVTHRDCAGSFAIVTAHDKTPNGKPDIDWAGLSSSIKTIAFYMGVKNLQYICDNLIKHGKSPNTPAIIIQWGTYGRQKSVEGTLDTIVDLAQKENITNPAITLVGEVVAARERISWFEKKALFGRQMVLVRTGTEESKLALELKENGADVIEFPKWRKEKAYFEPTQLNNLRSYDQILFASSEAANDFFDILSENKKDLRLITAELYGTSVKTIKALEAKGLTGFYISERKAVGKLLIVGDQQVIEEEENYKDNFGEVDLFITSFKSIDSKFTPIIQRQLEESEIDTLVFPNSKSVHVFKKQSSRYGMGNLPETVQVVCMGTKTKETAEACGILPNKIPAKPTIEAFIECLKEEYQLVNI